MRRRFGPEASSTLPRLRSNRRPGSLASRRPRQPGVSPHAAVASRRRSREFSAVSPTLRARPRAPVPRNPRRSGLWVRFAQSRLGLQTFPSSESNRAFVFDCRPGGRQSVECCCGQCGELFRDRANRFFRVIRNEPASQPTRITLVGHTGRGDRSNALPRHLAVPLPFVRGRSSPCRFCSRHPRHRRKITKDGSSLASSPSIKAFPRTVIRSIDEAASSRVPSTTDAREAGAPLACAPANRRTQHLFHLRSEGPVTGLPPLRRLGRKS